MGTHTSIASVNWIIHIPYAKLHCNEINDEVRFVLHQHTSWSFRSTSSLQQLSAGRHVG
jgi:hypothetical protein